MLISEHILSFYQNLVAPGLPQAIEALMPFRQDAALEAMRQFYSKYYADRTKRILLIGINPGRFGGGVTGIPFTDPIRLAETCGIANPFDRRQELSSAFMYEMIDAMGGPGYFYRNFYFTSTSPIGFVRDGKNLNYYDDKELAASWTPSMVQWMEAQVDAIGTTAVAVVIGKGKNQQYFEALNNEHNFFRQLLVVPHPRWVMQYRLKKKHLYIKEYVTTLSHAIEITNKVDQKA